MDEGSAPVWVGKQIVRPRAFRQEVLVSLIEHQGDAAPARELEKDMDRLARINGARGIVGRYEHDRARPRTDQPGGILDMRNGTRARPEVEWHRLDALHAQPHVVVE